MIGPRNRRTVLTRIEHVPGASWAAIGRAVFHASRVRVRRDTAGRRAVLTYGPAGEYLRDVPPGIAVEIAVRIELAFR